MVGRHKRWRDEVSTQVRMLGYQVTACDRGVDAMTAAEQVPGIEEIERLPAYLNSATWDSQAAISCDGRQLYFASTRAGGLGGSDLYTSERLPDGSWSEPRNLGSGVNTPEDEEAGRAR